MKHPTQNEQAVSLLPTPEGYALWLNELKARIHGAQQRAALVVNRELVLLYWQIGRDILQRQAALGWGSKVIERLAHDLRVAFPGMKGFSRANLMYMRAFAEAWPDADIVQQAVGQLPWGHNLVLLTKLKTPEVRLAYAQAAIEHGWSRNVLNIHIETRRLERGGQAITNFVERLPKPGRTRRPSAYCCAKARTKWWPNMPWPTSPNPWAWPSTSCWSPCPRSCKPICPVSSRSNANWVGDERWVCH